MNNRPKEVTVQLYDPLGRDEEFWYVVLDQRLMDLDVEVDPDRIECEEV